MRWQRATTWLVLAFAGCATAPTVPEPVPDVELFVLGVAQDGG